MARTRLGKAERLLRKEQWRLYKSLKRELIARNVGAPHPEPRLSAYGPDGKAINLGYKLTPNLKNGYAFHDPSNLPRISKFGMDNTKYGVK